MFNVVFIVVSFWISQIADIVFSFHIHRIINSPFPPSPTFTHTIFSIKRDLKQQQ